MATDAKERLQQQKGQELSQAPAPGLQMMRGVNVTPLCFINYIKIISDS